mgnify:CR=1 FL=1
MNNKEEKVLCQKQWAKNKYLVLSHSSKIYLEIRTYLKQEEVSQNKVSELIKQAVSLPEDKGQVTNALHHVWGYFKKYATKEEKDIFFEMIEEYHNNNNKYKKEDLIKEVKYLLNKYPNKYLEESTFINGGQDETLA